MFFFFFFIILYSLFLVITIQSAVKVALAFSNQVTEAVLKQMIKERKGFVNTAFDSITNAVNTSPEITVVQIKIYDYFVLSLYDFLFL